ncbi:MAG: acyl-CoA dehydratase activase [Thermodesulfobacteriota bacterium]
MITAGCDIGSLTAKAVVLKDGKIIGHQVIRVKANPADSADEVLQLAAEKAGIARGDINASVGTGYGKDFVSFADTTCSEISCHARGAWWNLPSVRTIIDIGGQDAKAIRIDDKGNVVRYIYNDKCAAGTGRFLEVMAKALEVDLADMGALSAQARDKIRISNQCVIFAETEVVSLINEGRDTRDIICGLHHAMANRVASLARSIEVCEEVVMTGGVAKNSGMFNALAEGLGVPVRTLPVDPQINGALGAALFAAELAAGK